MPRIAGRLTLELKVTSEDGEVLFKDNLGNGRPLDEVDGMYRDIPREWQLRYCRGLGRLIGSLL
jgi:hypothetical protein